MLEVNPVLLSSVITCPTGARLIIRDIEMWEQTGTSGALISLHGPSTALIGAWQRSTATPLGWFSWRGRVVLNPGESTSWDILSGTWAAIICGYELTLP
jgi:hypothetical protein